MIFTQVLGTPFMSYVLKMIENFKKQEHDRNSYLSKHLNTILDTILHVGKLCQHFSPLLTQLHLAIFYMNGKFYQFSKRLSGVQYVSIYFLLNNCNT